MLDAETLIFVANKLMERAVEERQLAELATRTGDTGMAQWRSTRALIFREIGLAVTEMEDTP